MKVGICSVAALIGAMGIVTNAVAVPESNSTTQDQSSLTPLISRAAPGWLGSELSALCRQQAGQSAGAFAVESRRFAGTVAD